MKAKNLSSGSAETAAQVIVPMSLRIPKNLHEALRVTAFYERSSLHAVILQGIQRIVEEKGYAKKHGVKI